MLSSCGDGEPSNEDYRKSYLSDTYTPTSTTAKLAATYNGVAVTKADAKVVFSSAENKVGDFEVINIIPNTKSLKIKSVPLTHDAANYKYDFAAETVSNKKTVKIEGNVQGGLLTVAITEK